MDLATLLDRYPQSSHEVSPGAGVRRHTSQDDLKEWIREFFHTRTKRRLKKQAPRDELAAPDRKTCHKDLL